MKKKDLNFHEIEISNPSFESNISIWILFTGWDYSDSISISYNANNLNKRYA